MATPIIAKGMRWVPICVLISQISSSKEVIQCGLLGMKRCLKIYELFMKLIKHDWGVTCLNDTGYFSIFITETIKDFLREILFIHLGTKEGKFIDMSFDGL